jgi:hypothetical protein
MQNAPRQGDDVGRRSRQCLALLHARQFGYFGYYAVCALPKVLASRAHKGGNIRTVVT